MAASVAVVALAVGGVVVGMSATTRALFSDTASGGDSRVGTATVELGAGGGRVELGYTDLRPGHRQVVDVTISYQGTVPADVTLEIAPSGSSALCVQRDGRWTARPGGAVTMAIGSAAPVSYCEVLNGRALPLASAVAPGSEHHVDVAVMLSKDADDALRGLTEQDVATVWARGGFTDHAAGTISITTAGRDVPDEDSDPQENGDPRGGGLRTGGDAIRGLGPRRVVDPGNSSGRPTSGASPMTVPIALPAECEQAGMRLDSFEDVIVLGGDQHTWNALEQRGQGAGPFLVVGTGGDDKIVGSEGADCIVGGGGRDTVTGGAGDDVLIGAAGADLLDGAAGDDWLLGGPGDDELRGGGGLDRFDGGPGGASCDAGPDAAGVDRCRPSTPPDSPPSTGGGNDRSGEQDTTPPTTNPPPTTSSPETTSPPATATPVSGSTGSAPPITAAAPVDPPDGGTASPSALSGDGEDPSAAPTIASESPKLTTGS